LTTAHDREVRKTFHRRRHSERIAGHPLANLTHQVWLFGALLILSSTADLTRCSKPGYV
jgi:hypothetical protein